MEESEVCTVYKQNAIRISIIDDVIVVFFLLKLIRMELRVHIPHIDFIIEWTRFA